MFDKLVVSKSSADENKRLGGWMLTALTVVLTALTLGLVVNLYSQNLSLGASEFEISELVMPVAQTAPPVPEQATPPKQNTEFAASKIPSRAENIQRLEESPVKPPDATSVTPSTKLARPTVPFTIGRDYTPPIGSNTGNQTRTSANETSGVGYETVSANNKKDDENPPEIKKKQTVDKPNKKEIIKSGGVVNGKAVNLVKPLYSPAAKAVKAAGEVKVQVTIDEDGRVISASAVSGHTLLRQASVDAARRSRFSPTFLSEQKVKVTGIIIYNFTN